MKYRKKPVVIEAMTFDELETSVGGGVQMTGLGALGATICAILVASNVFCSE